MVFGDCGGRARRRVVRDVVAFRNYATWEADRRAKHTAYQPTTLLAAGAEGGYPACTPICVRYAALVAVQVLGEDNRVDVVLLISVNHT